MKKYMTEPDNPQIPICKKEWNGRRKKELEKQYENYILNHELSKEYPTWYK